jgi:hypothetical protein
MRGTTAARSTARRWALAALFALAAATGCKPKGISHPFEETTLRRESEVSPDARRLVDAVMLNQSGSIVQWMTPSLRDQVSARDLSATGDRLRGHYGHPVGIVEERTHREGDMLWYSGLYVFAKGKPGSPDRQRQRLVLFQFATLDGKLDRLLIREHDDVRHLRVPARRYLLVTRIHYISDGEWTVAHGGRRRLTNYHHGSQSQRYAYDIVMLEGGRQRRGDGDSNKDYYCYGQPLYAPAPGTIVEAREGIPENVPGTRGEAGGNGVIIDHGFGEYSSIWHMIPGSLTVKAGDKVELGQLLGKVGNSGRSTGPHIHYHVAAHGSKRGEIGLPAPFLDVYVDGAWYPRKLPVRGHRLRRSKRDRRGAEVLLDASM